LSASESFELVGVTSLLELWSYLFPTIGEIISSHTSLAILAIVLGVAAFLVLEERLFLGVLSLLCACVPVLDCH